MRTNLSYEDVLPVKEQLTQSLFDHIPVGVGSKGVVTITAADLNDALVCEDHTLEHYVRVLLCSRLLKILPSRYFEGII